MPERPHRSEAEWQALILEHADSGQSALDFCRERGLYAKTFYRHRKALRKKGLVPPPPVRTSFVQLKTVPTKPPGSVPTAGVQLHHGGSCLRLSTNRGQVFRFEFSNKIPKIKNLTPLSLGNNRRLLALHGDLFGQE